MQKSLYGTPDAPKIWYKTIAEFLKGIGFEKCLREQCLFRNEVTNVVMMIYVDDLAVAGPTRNSVELVISQLKRKFDMREMGVPFMFLGINIFHYKQQRKIL